LKLNALSLFSSVGLAETYFERNNINVVLSNEILEKRCDFHSHLYPNSKSICGDITDKNVFDEVIEEAKNRNVNFIIATPPCQGMSTAGKMLKDDMRNKLIVPTIEVIKELKPLFIIIENVPTMLKTKIFIGGKEILIPDYIHEELSSEYNFNEINLVNAMNYGVPQNRQRCVFLLSKKELNLKWEFPEPSNKIITMRDAIGDLPSLDPHITDIPYEELLKQFPDYEKKEKEGLEVSKWHHPPNHKLRHVIAMMHTPEGHSAFENEIFYPKLKNGKKSKGYNNTYKRQWWDKPAYTITRYTSRIGSQNNGHPGRVIKDDGTEEGRIYSDARTLSVYELIILSSLPVDWDIPDWATDNIVREVIGEGVPPLLIEASLKSLNELIDLEDFNGK